MRGAQQAKDVDVEVGLELIQWLDRQRTHIRDAGIVDEAGQRLALQRRGHFPHGGVHLILLGHVQDQRTDIAFRTGTERVGIRLLAHARIDAPAMLGEVERCRFANTSRCACDHNRLHASCPSNFGNQETIRTKLGFGFTRSAFRPQ